MPRAQLSDSSPQTDAARLLLRVLLSGFSVSLLSYTVDASPSCTATKVLTTPQRRPSLLKRGSGSSPQTPSPGHSARCRCLDLDIRFCPEGWAVVKSNPFFPGSLRGAASEAATSAASQVEP